MLCYSSILLAVVVLDLDACFATPGRQPLAARGRSLRQCRSCATTGFALGNLGEEIQQRLEPLTRCPAHVVSFLRESLPLPSRGQFVSEPEAASTQAATIEGLRKALSMEGQVQGRRKRDDGTGSWWLTGILGRRVRSFRRRFDGMRDLIEAAAGNHPEIHPEEAADRLRALLETNQRELRRQVANANGLLAKWAVQASAEERRLEARLSEMREAQRSMLSGVVTTAEERLQRAALEAQVEVVRREWSERQAVLREQLGKRKQDIAQKMRTVTSDSKILAKIYDEFLMRKRHEMDTAVANEDTFRRALELILEDTEEGGWERVVNGRRGSLSVQRKFIGRNSGGSKFACIRAWCTMDVPAEAIVELFESSERVKEYNKWFLEGRDLELLDDDTMVVWASSPAPLPFVKPRDFVTVVNVRRLEDGSIVVVNRGYRHPAAPPSSDYVRGEVILAANVIKPDSKNRYKTHFTMLTQVDPGGIAPAWIVNKISARDPVDFLQRVEAAAGRSGAALEISAPAEAGSPRHVGNGA
eukprot:g20424.t1